MFFHRIRFVSRVHGSAVFVFFVISAFQLMVGGLGVSGLDSRDPWKVNQGLLRPEELPLE